MAKSSYHSRRNPDRLAFGQPGARTLGIYYLDFSWTGSPPFVINIFAVTEDAAGICATPFQAWELGKTFNLDDFQVLNEAVDQDIEVTWVSEAELEISCPACVPPDVFFVNIQAGTQSMIAQNGFRSSGMLGRVSF